MRSLFLATLGCLAVQASSAQSVMAAAARVFPDIQWQAHTEISADFICVGRKQSAILGFTDSKAVFHEGINIGQTNPEVVVAVFVSGTGKPPVTLQFQGRSTGEVGLKAEPLTTSAKEFKSTLGYVPQGFMHSKSCQGLILSDGDRDATHIYWNRARRVFSTWSL